jgi:hypothetical protein
MLAATLTLMVITSTGVFGYLSGEFQKAIAGNSQQTVVIKSLEEEQGRLQKRKEEIDKQIAQLPQNNVSGRRALMKQFDPEVKRLNDRLAEIDKKLPELKVANVEKELHVGPIMYVAEAFNTTPQEAVKWVNLIIIGVFDPLAIALLVAGNFLLKQRREEEERLDSEYADFDLDYGPPNPTITELMNKEDNRKFEAPILNGGLPFNDDDIMNNPVSWMVNHDLAMKMAPPVFEEPSAIIPKMESPEVEEPIKKKRKYVRKAKPAEPVEPAREKVVIKAPPKKPRAVTVQQAGDKEVIKLEPIPTNLENVDGRRGDVIADSTTQSRIQYQD